MTNRFTTRAIAGLQASLAAMLLAAPAFADKLPGCDALTAKYPDLQGKTVLMGADPSTPPYAMIDPDDPNKIIGADIDLADAVFECLGVEHDIKPGSWPGLFPAVVSGQIDVMFYLYHSGPRAEKGDFITYMRAGSGAIVQKGNPANIKSEDDLCGKTLSAGLGTVEERQAKKWSDECVAAGKPEINVMTSTDMPAGFRLVGSGRADTLISDLPLINMMIARNPDTYELGYSVVTDWAIGAAVVNDSPLGPAIYDAMKIVQAEGVQSEILNKYGISTELEIPTEFLTE